MAKDKRVKGCPNSNCKKAEEKAKFTMEENYCPICGSDLVLVCARCHGPLDDEGPVHKICGGCEAEINDRKEKILDEGKKVVGTFASAALAVFAVVKNKKL